MKKKAILGLIILNIAGVAQALEKEFQDGSGNGVDNLWSNSDNWFEKGTTTGTSLPTSNDKVDIVAGDVQVDFAGAESHNLFLSETLTITTDGTLASRTITVGGGGSVVNNGTFRVLLDIRLTKSSSTFVNMGDINVADVADGATNNLKISQGGIFTMNGGTYNSTGMLDAIATGTGGTLNLNGGTMNFTDVNWFDTGSTYYGDYTIDFAGEGTLVFDLDDVTGETRYGELVTIIGAAMTAGHITTDGVASSGATMVTDDTLNTITLTAVPEPATYAFFAGCFGFAWVMLRRGRS